MKKYLSVNNLALLYLWVPVMIFLAGWVKWIIAVPVLALSCYGLYLNFRDHIRDPDENRERHGKKYICWILVILILLVWCLLSGQKAFCFQAGDWIKHNDILEDLINGPWPLRYQYDGKEGVLSYYLLGYLFPALSGKWMGVQAAEWVLLFQTLAGLVLTVSLMARYAGVKNCCGLLLLCFVFILFSTFIFPLDKIYELICPGDVHREKQWMSSGILIQYSSNIIQLRWVFQQSVSAWIATILLMSEEGNVKTWGLICTPVILYSAFAFCGLAALVMVRWCCHIYSEANRKDCVKELFNIQNGIALAVLLVLTGYIAGNLLQPKPESVGMGLEFIDYSGHKTLFVLFQLSWGVWAVVLGWQERKNIWLYGAAVTLFVLPFFRMGYWNDLCMRTSIPALFVLCVLAAKNLACSAKKRYRLLVAAMVLLSSYYGLKELKWLSSTWNTLDGVNREISHGGLVGLFESEEFTVYQYVDWNSETGINSWLLRD